MSRTIIKKINISKTISSTWPGYNQREYFFWLLVAISIFSLGAYMYAIHKTAINIARSQELRREITSMTSVLNTLEFDYIKLKNDITVEVARQYGFREAESPVYISRNRASALSLNTSPGL